MSAQPPTSPRFSLKGFLLGVWFQKNKGAIKLLLTLLVAYLTVLLANVEPQELKALLVGGIGLIVKFGLDLADYFISENPR